jgi:hypothetical protein
LVAIAAQQAYTGGLQRVEGVLDLAQASIDVRKRQDREEAESSLVGTYQLGGAILVQFARQFPRLLSIAEPHAWSRDRHHRRRDTEAVETLDRPRRRVALPVGEARNRRDFVPGGQRRQIIR